MLSNAEIIILSLVNEKPSYAYEIEKQIEARNMRLWVKIGIASIYQVLNRLHDKGYLEFEVEREGKAPERKRYFTTGQGQSALRSSVKTALSKLEWYYLDLNVAFEGSDILSREEILECLKQRLDSVKYSLSKLREDVAGNQEKTKAAIIMGNIFALRVAEVKILEDLIKEYTKD